MVTRNVGKALFSYALLTDLLHLPEGHSVINARQAPNGGADGYFEILVEGPTLPESDEGSYPPDVQIICTMETGDPVPERKITTRIEPIK